MTEIQAGLFLDEPHITFHRSVYYGRHYRCEFCGYRAKREHIVRMHQIQTQCFRPDITHPKKLHRKK